MTSPPEETVGLWSHYGGLFTNFMCPFDYMVVAGSGEVGARKPVNHTSWLTSVISTDSPKTIRNCCVIGYFCDVICVTFVFTIV